MGPTEAQMFCGTQDPSPEDLLGVVQAFCYSLKKDSSEQSEKVAALGIRRAEIERKLCELKDEEEGSREMKRQLSSLKSFIQTIIANEERQKGSLTLSLSVSLLHHIRRNFPLILEYRHLVRGVLSALLGLHLLDHGLFIFSEQPNEVFESLDALCDVYDAGILREAVSEVCHEMLVANLGRCVAARNFSHFADFLTDAERQSISPLLLACLEQNLVPGRCNYVAIANVLKAVNVEIPPMTLCLVTNAVTRCLEEYAISSKPLPFTFSELCTIGDKVPLLHEHAAHFTQKVTSELCRTWGGTGFMDDQLALLCSGERPVIGQQNTKSVVTTLLSSIIKTAVQGNKDGAVRQMNALNRLIRPADPKLQNMIASTMLGLTK